MCEIIRQPTVKEQLEQFDPEIRQIFYDQSGKSLDTLPANLLHTNISVEHFLEGLLALRHTSAQRLILMRLGFVTGSPVTLEETAQTLGITSQRVRQIERMFLRRLHPHARCTNLTGFLE